MAKNNDLITAERFCNINGLKGSDRFVVTKMLKGVELTYDAFKERVISKCRINASKLKDMARIKVKENKKSETNNA